MQNELDALALPIPVQILGVNDVGHESGNDSICEDRDLPWLQPVEGGDDVWAAWGIEYRDVVLLDGENRAIAVFNLTDNNLSDPLLFEELRTMFVDASNDRAAAGP